MLASDVNNREFSGAMDPDAVMIARFYKRAVRNNFKSKQEGRPIFEDKIYCEYYPAGSTQLRMDVPADDRHKMRFAKQWAYYQSTQTGDASVVGTPLSQWPILSPADIENLKALKFQTIENLAGASDNTLQVLGMGMAGMAPHVLRARAQAYLGAAKDSALPQRQAEELENMKKELAEMKALLTAKAQTPEVTPEPPKGKRVWTPEQKAAASERMKKAREAKQNKAA